MDVQFLARLLYELPKKTNVLDPVLLKEFLDTSLVEVVAMQ
jgi:hypothetical protein